MYRPTEGRRPRLHHLLHHLLHLFLGLGLLLLGLAAQARPLSLVLFPGDPATLTAVNAVQQLQREPALKEVRFHIASSSQPSPADLEALAKADLALIYNMGRDLAKNIAPAVAEINRRGAKAYAVGSPFEEGEADLSSIAKRLSAVVLLRFELRNAGPKESLAARGRTASTEGQTVVGMRPLLGRRSQVATSLKIQMTGLESEPAIAVLANLDLPHP